MDATHSFIVAHRLFGSRSHSRSNSRALQTDDSTFAHSLLRTGMAIPFEIFHLVLKFYLPLNLQIEVVFPLSPSSVCKLLF